MAPKEKTYCYKGELLTHADIRKKFGVDASILTYRLKKGMSLEEALHTPVRPTGVKYTWNGKTQGLRQWADELGLVRETLDHRLNKGWTFEQAITTPTHVSPDQEDLTGRVFGRLTILGQEVIRGTSQHRWRARCTCGNEGVYKASDLLKGNTRSCGCLKRDLVVARNTTHGLSRRAEYCAWNHMKARCSAPEGHKDYEAYAGRGITVCERWKDDFTAFFEDMGPRPGKGYSIDRIDVNGNYEPGNCRWATATTQARNKRDSVWIEFQGEHVSLQEWAERTGLDRKTIQWRLNQGWTVEKTLTSEAFDSFRSYEFRERKNTLKGWAEEYGYAYGTVKRYLDAGMTLEAILTMFEARQEAELLEIDGVKKLPKEWAAEYGITTVLIRTRMKVLGWSAKDAVTKPSQRRKPRSEGK